MCSCKSFVTNVYQTVAYHITLLQVPKANDYVKSSEEPCSKQTLVNPAFKQLFSDRTHSGTCATVYSALNSNSYKFGKTQFAFKYDLQVAFIILLI